MKSRSHLNGRSGLPGRFAWPAVIVAITLAAYLPAMQAGYIWDDDDYVTENETLLTADGLQRIWFELGAVPQYYPLVHTTYWIEYRLWGLNPTGYHLTNILLHAGSAVLVGIVLTRLAVPGAWLAAAVFAVHPVHVESVAWITERKNVLSAVFYLAALLVYLRWCGLVDEPMARGRKGPVAARGKLYAIAFALFIAALLSKTVTATLPAAILVLTWWKRGHLTRNDVLPLVPMFLVGLAMGSLTGWMERNYVGARGPAFDWTFVERVLIAGRAVWFYLGKLLWPYPLIFVYPRWEIDPTQFWQWLFPLTAAAVPILLWLLRHRLGRGPLVAALYFGGTLVPALGFVNVYPMIFSYVADHFQYLASLGAITAFSAAAARVWHSRPAPQAGQMAACLLLLILGVLTWRQCSIYRNAETLWRDTLAKNPRAALAHHNLAILLRDRGQLDEAEQMLRTSIELQPGFVQTYNALGRTLELKGQHEAAIEQYRRALEIDPQDLPAHYNWGNALRELGRFAEAEEHYREALRINPNDAPSQLNLGVALSAQKRFEEALPHYQAALRLNPAYALAHRNLGLALGMLGRAHQAQEHLQRAVELDSEDHLARYYLAMLCVDQGDFQQAVRLLQEALQLAPDFQPAQQALARLTGRGN